MYLVLSIAIFMAALYKSPPAIFLAKPLRGLGVITVVLLAIAWNISPTFPGQLPGRFYGLIFHFYGASLLTAMFGPAIALSLLFPIAFIGIFLIQGSYIEASQQYLMVGMLPVTFSYLSISIIQRFVPRHLFVLIFGNGYVAAFASVILSGITVFAFEALIGTGSANIEFEGWLLGLIIIAFMEASLSGMLLAIFLIFRPHWVSTYNEDAYMSR